MATGFLLPEPPGPYNVSLTTGPLVDQSRAVTQADMTTPWSLMLSVFQPTACESTITVPYMPDQTAKFQGQFLQQAFNISSDFTPLFLSARLPVCPPSGPQPKYPRDCPTSPPNSPRTPFPILLFSPGWGVSRLYYTTIASAIASHGFTVITLDSPSDASIITYPNNSTYLSPNLIFSRPVAREAEAIRATDISFVLDQLHAPTPAITALVPHLSRDTDPRVAVLGHSLGGAASLLAASRDGRIKAAVNWDGSLFSDLASPSSSTSAPAVDQPVLLLMDAVTAIPEDWEAAWPRFTGPKMWVVVNETTHQSFSDASVLLEAGGVVKEGEGELEGLLGKIGGGEMLEVLAGSTARWMGAAFGEGIELGKEGLGEYAVGMEVLKGKGL